MKRKLRLLILIFLVINSPALFSETVFDLAIGDTLIITKDTFEIPVMVENVSDLEGMYINIQFNSSHINPISAALEGGILDGHFYTIQSNKITDSTLAVVLVAQGASIVSGSGKLFTMSFIHHVNSVVSTKIIIDSVELNESVFWEKADTGIVEIAPIIKSKNADLESLLVDEVLISGFDKNTTEYSLNLPLGTYITPDVSYILDDSSATASVRNAVDVRSESTEQRTTFVFVTAEDTTVNKTYKIEFNVLRSTNANLKSILVDNVEIADFNEETTDYFYTLGGNVTITPEVTAIVSDSTATVDIFDAVDVTSNLQSDRTTTLVVLAEDDSSTREYKVIFETETTGINNSTKGTVSIYPTRVTDKLYLDAGSMEIQRLQIIDMTGRTILQISDLKNQSLNLSNISSGVYFIKIQVNNQFYLKRITKE